MLLNLKTAMIVATVATCAGEALAQDTGNGFYVAASASYGAPKDADQVIRNAPVAGSSLQVDNPLDKGWGGSVAGGYRFANHFRLEGEVGRGDADSDVFRITSPFTASIPQDGSVKITRYMVNAYLDFGGADARLRPYVGGGVGRAEIELYRFAGTAAAPNNRFVHIDDSATETVWQAMAGVALKVTPSLSVTGQYRWLDAGTVDHTSKLNQPVGTEIAGGFLDVGLRFAF